MRERTLLIGLLTITLLAGPVSRVVAAPMSLFDRLLDLEDESAGLCPTTQGREETTHQIQALAQELLTGFSTSTTAHEKVQALNQLLFERLGVQAAGDLHDPCNLLPSAVLRRRQGYCVGVAALYLGIAEEMRLPVYAVATPAHLFLRFDDGSTRINIEATAMGAMRTDEEYAREGGMPGASLHKGVFLRNLSDDQFLAQVHSNLGVVYSERKNDVAAAREFERALNLDPGLPAAWYNRGNDRLRRVDYRGAVKDFSRALDLYPIDVWALNNRGVAYRNLDKSGKARRDFEAALRIDPGFEPARKNLDALAGRR